jgi:hypothetical protein
MPAVIKGPRPSSRVGLTSSVETSRIKTKTKTARSVTSRALAKPKPRSKP